MGLEGFTVKIVCEVGSLPFTYLGVSLGADCKSIAISNSILGIFGGWLVGLGFTF